MSEFEELFSKLLEQKPEITRSEIEERIKQKKEKIGAGYLTDQGALFLIASDLGISLSEPLKVEMSLKDLYVGAKEISLETRVLNFSPVKQFTRKDGSPFFLRSMTVYDGEKTGNVKLWDEKANLPGFEKLKPGDLIKIIKAYVKSDLNGNPTINIGSGSSIESSDAKSDIPKIDSFKKDVNLVKENEKDLVVSGILDGTVNTIEFTNSRGQKGQALNFRLKGKNGQGKRVVIWGKGESDLPKLILAGSQIQLFGVRTKQGNQDLEIHGNDSTIIQIEDTNEDEPINARILDISQNNDSQEILVVNERKEIFNITNNSKKNLEMKKGDIIECIPSKALGNSLVVDENSFFRKIEDNGKIPTISGLRTKIADVKIGSDYCIEAIILKIPGRREVQTRTGESVAISEIFVEDDTGQIWVKGWRERARLLDKCAIGEIISVTGVSAKAGLEGRVELFLNPLSRIIKKS